MFLHFDEGGVLPLWFYVSSEPADDDPSQILIRVTLVDEQQFELEGNKLATSRVDMFPADSDVVAVGTELAATLVYDIRARYLEIETMEAGLAAIPVTKDMGIDVDYLRLFRNADAPLGGDE